MDDSGVSTRITIQLYLLSVVAVLSMGLLPGAAERNVHLFAFAGAAVLVFCAVLAHVGEHHGNTDVIQASLLLSNLLISVSVAALNLLIGQDYEIQMFYLLPLLVAAHFHERRFVRLSIALTAIGHPTALLLGTWSAEVGAVEVVSDTLASSIPVVAVTAAVTELVHRLRQRDLAQRALLQSQASTDPLTQLMNRRGLRQAIDDARVSAGSCAIVMIDIDHFKAINDAGGHEVGDQVLEATAHLLLDAAAENDLTVRFGGEEFLVLLDGRSHDAAEQMTSDLSDAFARLDVWSEAITASYGITEWVDGEPFSNAVQRADAAVYEAKAAGRDRSCVRLPALVSMPDPLTA